MTSEIKVVILYLWLGRKGKFFEVKEREEVDKTDMGEMEWISEMFEKGVESFDKIVDKMVKEKGNGKDY